jgi:hypothetical protein
MGKCILPREAVEEVEHGVHSVAAQGASLSHDARASAGSHPALRPKKGGLPALVTPPTPPAQAGPATPLVRAGSAGRAGPAEGGARGRRFARAALTHFSVCRADSSPECGVARGRTARPPARARPPLRKSARSSTPRTRPVAGRTRARVSRQRGATRKTLPIARTPHTHLQLLDGEGPGLLVHGVADLVVRDRDGGGFHGGHGVWRGGGFAGKKGKKEGPTALR